MIILSECLKNIINIGWVNLIVPRNIYSTVLIRDFKVKRWRLVKSIPLKVGIKSVSRSHYRLKQIEISQTDISHWSGLPVGYREEGLPIAYVKGSDSPQAIGEADSPQAIGEADSPQAIKFRSYVQRGFCGCFRVFFKGLLVFSFYWDYWMLVRLGVLKLFYSFCGVCMV